MLSGPGPAPLFASFAARRGLRYEPVADERWLRAWEPYATLKVPLRYEHVLQATGELGSMTIARMVQLVETHYGGQPRVHEAAAWIAIVQDERLVGVAAATSDARSPFAEPLDLVTMARRATGDVAFDAAFAAFAATAEDCARAIGPSLRKLVLSWRAPLHFEVRKGGFVLAPVALAVDEAALSWFVDALAIFGQKAYPR